MNIQNDANAAVNNNALASDQLYKVVVNHEEQYSIWPAEWSNPAGWNDVGKAGSKAECLSYIAEVWTDMRPLSVRQRLG